MQRALLDIHLMMFYFKLILKSVLEFGTINRLKLLRKIRSLANRSKIRSLVREINHSGISTIFGLKW